ncbi:unnamed protein product, partial [Brassica rapa]
MASYVWKMLEKLDFKDDQGSESFGWFIEKSLQLHKAPKLVSLVVELGPTSHADVDVGKWVDKAVKHGALSSSPVLFKLVVARRDEDSLTNFTVKVPSLKILTYKTRFHDEEEVKEEEEEEEYYIRSLVACSNAIKFSRLIELYFTIEDPVDWLEPFICLLQNSPILKALTIFTIGCPPSSSSWNQPSTIPPCLSSQLETFKWLDYGGKEDDKQLMTYILANSICLKTVDIKLIPTCNIEECQKELESMPGISPSSLL